MERALKVFSEHSNMRFFMLGIINCNHTPFIFKLSELNGKPPAVNVNEQKVVIHDLLRAIHAIRQYFGAKKAGTYDDFLLNDESTSQLVFNYVMNGLYSQLTRQQYDEILGTILEPYWQDSPRQAGGINS